MKLLRNYLLKDFISAFIFSFLFLSMIMSLGNFVRMPDLIRKGVHIADVMKISSFFFLGLLKYIVPLAFLAAILLAMGRFIADNEIVAMNVAGISIIRIMRIFLVLGFITALSLFILNDRIIPRYHYLYRTQMKNIYSKNITALIEPGVFLEHFQNFILYVSDKEKNHLKGIFIYEVDEDDRTNKVTFAKSGEFVVEGNILKMKLEDGFRDETKTGKKKQLSRMEFQRFFMDIPIVEKKAQKVEKKAADMTTKELRQKISYLRGKDIPVAEMLAEFHNRISISFSVITFIVLGFGISLVVKHREKSINFGVAFISAGAYYLLFILGQTLVEYHYVIPSLGMWLPNIVMCGIGTILLWKYAYLR